MIIGLTGTNGAGKGTVAEFLKSLGYSYNSLSDAIRDELASLGLEASRENLIAAGNRLRETFGPAILAQRILQKLDRENNHIVDSVRNPHEVEALRERNDFFLIAVDAPIELRFQRCQARGRNESAATLQEFAAIENREKGGEKTSQQIDNCMAMADFSIINDGSMDQMDDKVRALLETMEAKLTGQEKN